MPRRESGSLSERSEIEAFKREHKGTRLRQVWSFLVPYLLSAICDCLRTSGRLLSQSGLQRSYWPQTSRKSRSQFPPMILVTSVSLWPRRRSSNATFEKSSGVSIPFGWIRGSGQGTACF